MKKIPLLVFLIIVFINSVNCQITKGNWMIGGNAEFSKQKTSFISGGAVSSTQIDINPKAGYFVADKFALGLFLIYGHVVNKSYNLKSSYNNVGLGPYVRYYFLSQEKATNIILEGSGGFTSQKDNTASSKSSFISYALLAGLVFYFNSSVGIELLAGYKGYRTTKSETNNNGIHFNIGIQVHLETEK